VLEAALQDFKIVDKIYLKICIPFDFMKGYFVRKSCIEELTINVSSTKLLDFGE
jgi:hypothetical protein